MVNWQAAGGAVCCCIWLLPGMLFDLRTRQLPGWYLTAGLAGGALFRVFLCVSRNGGQAAAWLLCLIPGVVLLVLSWATRESVGRGDGICYLVIGMLEGTGWCALILLLSLLMASVYGGFLLMAHAGRKKRMAFLPFTAAASLLVLGMKLHPGAI